MIIGLVINVCHSLPHFLGQMQLASKRRMIVPLDNTQIIGEVRWSAVTV